MKKLLLIALLALTFSAGAQVTYIGEVEGVLEYNLYSTRPADRYLVYSEDGWDIYNPDLTLYKSFHGLPYYSSDDSDVECYVRGFLGKHAVNNDDKYEFLVLKEERTRSGTYIDGSNFSITTTLTRHIYIYNEDGDVLYTFPDVFVYQYHEERVDDIIVDIYTIGQDLWSVVVHLLNGELRVAITYEDFDLDRTKYTRFYKFNGRPDMEDIVEVPEAGVRSMPAFPNPTRGEVTLPYTLPQGERATMQIFDMSGRLIEQRPISGEGRMVKVDVSAYEPGVYLYEYKGQTNRFVVR
ncbi:MAG: T9SS type A sorting domain-containing protein [Bacteroidales bacterium]|nr:T9SS type A sorting domain-containing protein [Bacteroidales bacterium]